MSVQQRRPWERAIIENVTPQVDCGRFPAKRSVGDRVVVQADAFTDGHDVLRCRLKHRHESEPHWTETEMTALVNDRWRGEFQVPRLGRYHYTLTGWVDHFLTWQHDFERRVDPADIETALKSGALIVREAAARAAGPDAKRLEQLAQSLLGPQDMETRRHLGVSKDLARSMSSYPDRSHAADYERELTVVVEPVLARYSTWYELFPRSTAAEPGRHGTFRDCIKCLPAIAEMGFDVLYLPPIHPIGRLQRKGPNNTLTAGPQDPGSPWAIGSSEGGHLAIHPELGSGEDFRALVKAAAARSIAVALDIAFQCAPDHPYVTEHPQWFRWRPDGTVQYAENPPKKYQDIYPFDFENPDWKGLFEELKNVFLHWIEQGVTVFRVDNPHTKPFAMWEWLIGEVRKQHPEAIFLSEAFTRPRVMHRLAKLGFSQSYTYFTWRNTRQELTEYFTELTQHHSREYFRPNAWPNTPDILPEYLQIGGRPAFMTRLVLAATLSANYGIYGPSFELLENQPRAPGSEEYLDSEKYEIRQRDLSQPHSLRPFITRVNRIRRENPALQENWNLGFCPVDNEAILCYYKSTADGSNTVIIAVNLDPHHVQSGWVDLPLQGLGIAAQDAFQMHDLLTDQRFLWHGSRNFLQLDPSRSPAHIFVVRKQIRSERDFDYFL
ncbi:MAG: alpha-1,4-glucan--maltose-1-phosphate maltosyltransferase [Lautropia sp.]|nr:alpha-1,4-glucan--maltose-1-phosphate maltosyltransferase [Lautropia sp.]